MHPHTVTIGFRRRTSLSHVAIFLNHRLDESYTPSHIKILVGPSPEDCREVRVVEVKEPHGWYIIHLASRTHPEGWEKAPGESPEAGGDAAEVAEVAEGGDAGRGEREGSPRVERVAGGLGTGEADPDANAAAGPTAAAATPTSPVTPPPARPGAPPGAPGPVHPPAPDFKHWGEPGDGLFAAKGAAAGLPRPVCVLPLRARTLQVAVADNHLNGKDTHLRQVRVYEYVGREGADEVAGGGARRDPLATPLGTALGAGSGRGARLGFTSASFGDIPLLSDEALALSSIR